MPLRNQGVHAGSRPCSTISRRISHTRDAAAAISRSVSANESHCDPSQTHAVAVTSPTTTRAGQAVARFADGRTARF